MSPDERMELESKKLKLRLLIVLIIIAFFGYLMVVRPIFKAAF
jgi:hypothetical protein